MPRSLPTAEAFAAKWAARMGDGTTSEAYRKGVLAATTNPMAAAASDAAQQKYRDATSRASNSGKMSASLNAVPFQTWKDRASTTGAQNLAGGAAKGKAKLLRAGGKLIAMWQAQQSAVAAVGAPTPGNAKQRWNASFDAQMAAIGRS